MLTKEYSRAFRDLRRYAESRGVKTSFVSESTMQRIQPGSCACFSPMEKKIRISRNVPHDSPELIYIFSHEIGHPLDHKPLTPAELFKNLLCLRIFHNSLRKPIDED